MKDIILDTLMDSLKLLPFLFLTFLLIEYIEHKIRNKNIITSSKKLGPFFGSILGAFPQCGFSASATNLYATRIITLGTLISVYLSTSDEMLPIMISENAPIELIIKILCIKILIGMICGFLIDFLLRKNEKDEINELCEKEHCHCEHGIFKSAFKHTINILFFIAIISFFLNISLEYLGEDALSKIFMKNNIFSSFISSLIGLIPNCGASVMITELYLNDAITFGSMLAGLLTGSGIGILILFKTNNNFKQNIKILLLIYMIGVISGILFDLLALI